MSMSGKVSTLVKPQWLANVLKSQVQLSNVRLLDGSWHMSATQRCGYVEYLEGHIPTAQYFDIDQCADTSSQFAHTLPSPEKFADYVGNIGIDNDTHVVVYDNNDIGLFSAPRVWWMFRIFGHDMVSILDGGLPAWKRDGLELTKVIEKVSPKTFRSSYKADLFKNFEQMLANISSSEFQVVDARGEDSFLGKAEPKKGIKSGHIPNSINLPYRDMLDPKKKCLKQPEEIKDMFASKGINLDQPLVASCGAGISACILMLGAHVCGKEDVACYDGSWKEWYTRARPEHKANVPDD